MQAAMMMSLSLTLPPSLLFLFIISGGVVAQPNWSVDYTQTYICALRTSTVTIGCNYTHNVINSTVRRAFWSKTLVTDQDPTDLSVDQKYTHRVQYIRATPHDCSLRLGDVTQEDQGMYYFTFITSAGERFQGKGVELSVTDFRVKMSKHVLEGAEVTLTCESTCTLTDTPKFTWHKSGSNFSFSSNSNQLFLQSVKQTDAGMYSCGVQGQAYRSSAASLDVQYPPKRASVSISPFGEIVEGSSVTLTCSSDANPPVHHCTWYKGSTFIKTGDTYTIDKISSEDSGDYICKARNQHGELNSDEGTLNVLYPPKSVSVSISPFGEIVEGSSVTLTCNSSAKPPVETYSWYKGTTYITTANTYNIYRISSEDSRDYRCKATNQYGKKFSDEAALNVLYPPKRVSVSISPSSNILEGSAVTLTCSSDANPPAYDYTWFKVNEVLPVGSGQRHIFIMNSSSMGWFYCMAKNKYGSQKAAAVPVNISDVSSSAGHVVIYIFVVGVVVVALLAGVFYIRRKRQIKSQRDHVVMNQPSATDDNYTNIDPQTRSSDDVYSTIGTGKFSSDYNNLPTAGY